MRIASIVLKVVCKPDYGVPSYQIWWLRRNIKYFITIYDYQAWAGKLQICMFLRSCQWDNFVWTLHERRSTCALERNHDKLILRPVSIVKNIYFFCCTPVQQNDGKIEVLNYWLSTNLYYLTGKILCGSLLKAKNV